MADPKLCKDCRYFHDAVLPEYPVCLHPLEKRISPVTGEVRSGYCEVARTGDGDIGCGKEGKFWEEKGG